MIINTHILLKVWVAQWYSFHLSAVCLVVIVVVIVVCKRYHNLKWQRLLMHQSATEVMTSQLSWPVNVSPVKIEKWQCAFSRMFSSEPQRGEKKTIKPINTTWKIDWALTDTWGPSGLVRMTGTAGTAGTAGTITTASAAATGAAAAASGRLTNEGFTCSRETKTPSHEVSHSSNWPQVQVLGHTSVLPLGCGTPCLSEPRACQGEDVIWKRWGRDRTQHRCYSQLLQDSASGRQPAAAATVTTWTSLTFTPSLRLLV